MSEERRGGSERRQETKPVAEERRTETRRKVQRRRQIDPTTCERDYTGEEIEFMQAIDAYKRANGRMFPTCSEILEVIRDMGYIRLTPEEQAEFAAIDAEELAAAMADAPEEEESLEPALDADAS